MFAGRGLLIQEWKNWIRSNPVDDSNQPAVEGISLSGFNISSKTLRYTEGMSITHENSIFAGTGARHAVICWKNNRVATKAVETAKIMDPASGGSVKYFDFATGNSNLAVMNMFSPSTIEEIDKELAVKGIYMDVTTRQNGAPPFALSQVAASDASANTNESMADMQELKRKLASGELSASAPCDAMYSEWSANSKKELKTFLGSVFGWRN